MPKEKRTLPELYTKQVGSDENEKQRFHEIANELIRLMESPERVGPKGETFMQLIQNAAINKEGFTTIPNIAAAYIPKKFKKIANEQVVNYGAGSASSKQSNKHWNQNSSRIDAEPRAINKALDLEETASEQKLVDTITGLPQDLPRGLMGTLVDTCTREYGLNRNSCTDLINKNFPDMFVAYMTDYDSPANKQGSELIRQYKAIKPNIQGNLGGFGNKNVPWVVQQPTGLDPVFDYVTGRNSNTYFAPRDWEYPDWWESAELGMERAAKGDVGGNVSQPEEGWSMVGGKNKKPPSAPSMLRKHGSFSQYGKQPSGPEKTQKEVEYNDLQHALRLSEREAEKKEELAEGKGVKKEEKRGGRIATRKASTKTPKSRQAAARVQPYAPQPYKQGGHVAHRPASQRAPSRQMSHNDWFARELHAHTTNAYNRNSNRTNRLTQSKSRPTATVSSQKNYRSVSITPRGMNARERILWGY